VKQPLAAIRMLFDWLVIRQGVPIHPALSHCAPILKGLYLST
jgi:hypothetical protein